MFFDSCVFYRQFQFKETTKACLMFPLVREMAIASQLPTSSIDTLPRHLCENENEICSTPLRMLFFRPKRRKRRIS